MKQIILMVVAVIMTIGIGFGQQGIVIEDNKTESNDNDADNIDLMCVNIKKEFQKIKIQREFNEESPEKLEREVKETIMREFFQNVKSEYNKYILDALLFHAVSKNFIKVKMDEAFFDEKINAWTIFIEDAEINKVGILEAAKKVNEFFLQETVVIYNPNFFKDDTDFGEKSRSYLQAAYIDANHQRATVKSIDRMPPNCFSEGEEDINYFDEVLKCITKHVKGIAGYKIGVVLRDYEEIDKGKRGSGWESEIKLHIQVINFSTGTIALDAYITGPGYGNTPANAKLNAVELTIKDNIHKLLYEEVKMYFVYLLNGVEANINVPEAVFNTFELEELKARLNQNCLDVKHDDFDDELFISKLRIRTSLYTQAEIISMLRRIIKNDFPEKQKYILRIYGKGERIIIKAKEQ
jgi:hypothetical protein